MNYYITAATETGITRDSPYNGRVAVHFRGNSHVEIDLVEAVLVLDVRDDGAGDSQHLKTVARFSPQLLRQCSRHEDPCVGAVAPSAHVNENDMGE